MILATRKTLLCAVYACAILTMCGCSASGNQEVHKQPSDSAPVDGVLEGCEVIRQGGGIVVNYCDGSSPLINGIVYLFTADVVADHDDRVLFNQMLTTLVGSSRGYCEVCSNEATRDMVTSFFRAVDNRRMKEFLNLVFERRSLDLWPDGTPDSVYQVFSTEFTQPQGGVLLNQAIYGLAQTCDVSSVSIRYVVDLVALNPSGMERTLDTMSQCESNELSVEWLQVAAVGLTWTGRADEGAQVLREVRQHAQTVNDRHTEQQVDRLEQLLPSLPNDPQELTDLLMDLGFII